MNKFSIALCCGVGGLAVTSPAFAQQTVPNPEQPASDQTDTIATVVITGSRIVRDGYSAPTPVTAVTLQDMQTTTPSNIPDALNKLPIFAGNVQAAGNTNAAGAQGGGRANTFGGNYLNLRNMGPVRTLVLLDGRRIPASTLSGLVDANTLPEQLVQRVDVVTGGVSAVYGSDAVTGVVNYILDKEYTGFEVFAQGGRSTYGDDQSHRFGIKAGATLFSGRGHLIASFEQNESNGTTIADRRWSADMPGALASVPGLPGSTTGTAANPYRVFTNTRANYGTFGGRALTGPFVGQQFSDSGALVPYDPGIPTGNPSANLGGDGAHFTEYSQVFPVDMNKGFARLQYDFTDNLQTYLQVSAVDSKSDHMNRNPFALISYDIYSDNFFLTPSQRATLAANNVSRFTVGRWFNDLMNAAWIDQDTSNLNVTAGLTGKTFGNFKWDAYYTHGRTTLTSKFHNNVYLPNLYAAIDAVQGPSGQPVCQVSLTTNANLYRGCQPVNLFGSGNESQAGLNYIFQNTEWRGVNTMNDVALSVSGDVFHDWAGPVSVALAFEYRDQSLTETTNASPLAPDPLITYNTINSPVGVLNIPTGIVGVRPSGAPPQAWAYSTEAPQHGSNSVSEVGGELVVPLLTDAPMVKYLEMSGAARYTDYSASGSVTTWKAGLNYQPIDDLRFRFSVSHDIRAPTLYDLYAGASIGNARFTDPISGQSSTAPQLTAGNPNLKPEESDTTTVGFVYSPSWLSRFRMSVDYYNIDMKNAITSLNGTNAFILAECQASNGTSPLCASAIRATPTSFPLAVTNLTANLAKLYTHGVDLDASYNFMLDDLVQGTPGRIDLRLFYSYQPVLSSVNSTGSPVQKQAGVAGVSVHRVALNLGYHAGPVSVNWLTRWQSSQALSGTPLVVYAGGPLPAIFYHDLSFNYDMSMLGRRAGWYFVVNNLANQAPRIAPTPNLGAAPGASNAVAGDDQIGRYFTLGLRVKF
jgi:iron complex outermembrane receptor protein